jgi:hypothetical protein
MRSAAVGRGLALAISFLFVGVAGGGAGHALAGLEGHGPGSAVLTPDVPSDASDSAPSHDAATCLLCRAARVSEVTLNTSVACTPAIAGECSAMSLPEALAPSTPRRRTEAARAPPARLAV